MIFWLYIIFSAFITVLLFCNFIKAKNKNEEILYILIIIPFLLRVLRLK
jgi:hypothetical protein